MFIVRKCHNGTNIIPKHDTKFLREAILEFFMVPTVKTHLCSWLRRFHPFNLERQVWVIKKCWKNICIQRPKIHQKQTFFPGEKSLLTSVMYVVNKVLERPLTAKGSSGISQPLTKLHGVTFPKATV
jgi:hypothetical protein